MPNYAFSYISNQVDFYWAILHMVENMSRSNVDVENIECMSMINNFLTIFVLKNFNNEIIISKWSSPCVRISCTTLEPTII